MSDTWLLASVLAFIGLNLVGDVIAYRKARREHREWMDAFRRQWREEIERRRPTGKGPAT